MNASSPNNPRPPVSFMKKVKKWAGKTSFHAVPHIAASKSNFIKIIWVIFLLASTVFCGYLLISETMRFLGFNVNTVVQITRDSNALFPAVTLCPIQQCEFDNYDFKKYFDNYVQVTLNSTGKLTQAELDNKINSASVKQLLTDVKNSFLSNHSHDDLEK